MKKTFIFIILSLFLLGTYNNVFADYKIILKNGGKFIVSDYKKEGNSIKLYTPNGEIEIDKNNVESIQETESVEETDKTPAQNIPSEKNESKITLPLTKTESQENPPSEILKKQKELEEKKKELLEESKKLDEDLAKEGRTTSIRKKRELEQRSQELKKKADEYNKEAESYK